MKGQERADCLGEQKEQKMANQLASQLAGRKELETVRLTAALLAQKWENEMEVAMVRLTAMQLEWQ